MNIKDSIIKTEIKTVLNQKWKFEFRDNGYVILSLLSKSMEKQKEVAKSTMQLHGVDLESCLNYIFKYNRGRCGYLVYDEMED